MTVKITYNPYLLKTEITINSIEVDFRTSHLAYVAGKRLQEWIEPIDSWKGIFKELREQTGDSSIELGFEGTTVDYKDLSYAKEKYGSCFKNISLTHLNKETADQIDPYKKVEELKDLYSELRDGPVDEFKTDDIEKNFQSALNSEFKITIIAPMSSGKSTLINAFIEDDLLPEANQATTAVITEIKDNDNFDSFILNAKDKYGNTLAENEKASSERIKELNDLKDNKDASNKSALVDLIKLEGQIPNLNSSVLNTVFVDTPGGNNSQNSEHEQIMDNAINDENKSLILYVFNGNCVETNDSNRILQKIADAIKNSNNGKQARDRFLFVANKMDDYDPEKESFDSAKDNILKMLEANGITEPNLFLVSAQAAKLIRMEKNKIDFTTRQRRELKSLVDTFNDSSYCLTKYASLNASTKEKLLSKAQECNRIIEKSADDNEKQEAFNRIAEIYSGIPAVESAIQEYLDKYAISIKIKTVRDTFMKKVKERNMWDNAQKQWAESEEKCKALFKEIKEKKEKHKSNEELRNFKEEINKIELNKEEIYKLHNKFSKQMSQINEKDTKEVEKSEAKRLIDEIEQKINTIANEVSHQLEDKLENGVIKKCNDIFAQYQKYIKGLENEGLLSLSGGFSIKDTLEFQKFKINKAEELTKYTRSKPVPGPPKKEKKSGFKAMIYRWFKNDKGWEIKDIFVEKEYVNLNQLILNQINSLESEFVKYVEESIGKTSNRIDDIKKAVLTALDGIDNTIQNQWSEIENITNDYQKLQNKVKENEIKRKFIEEFIEKMEKLLKI